MPVAKKLDCVGVVKLALEFFEGVPVKELAKNYKVSRLTISRIIGRETYKECTHLNTMVNAIGLTAYLDKVEAQMLENKKIGRGPAKGSS